MAGPLGRRGATIGRLRHRVKVQKLADSPSRDEAGQPVEAWEDVGTYWCEVVPVGGRELFESGHVQAQVSHRVFLRGRAGVTERMRLVWLDAGDAVLNIVGVARSVGRSNRLEVQCLEDKQG